MMGSGTYVTYLRPFYIWIPTCWNKNEVGGLTVKTLQHIAIIVASFVLLNLSSCMTMYNFEPDEIREFKKKVSAFDRPEKMGISSRYSYGSALEVTVSSASSFEKETVFSVLSLFIPIAKSEEFQSKLFEAYRRQAPGDINWELGWRPTIRLEFRVKGKLQYCFVADYYLEGYNSANDPNSYTFDGYVSWEGGELDGDSYSADEIEDILAKLY